MRFTLFLFLFITLNLTFLSVRGSDLQSAQSDSTAYYKFTLMDDSEIIGKLISTTPETYDILTHTNLRITIKKDQIKNVEMIEPNLSKFKIFRKDPHDSHLFLAPTAKTLPAGKFYFSVYELFFPVVSVGITDFFMLSGGFSLVPGIDLDEQIKYVSAKISPTGDSPVKFAFSTTYFSVWEEQDFTAGFGTVTYSSGRVGLTGGVGFGFNSNEFMETPILILGGELQISNSAKLITENWIWAEEDVALLSFGIRFFSEKLAGDFGFLLPATKSTVGGFAPWLGFSYLF